MSAYMPYNTQHERTEAEWLVDTILGNGNTISVNDGEEWTVKRSINRHVILEAMGSTDNDTLKVRTPSGESLGSFWLVYGNSSGELIADDSGTDYCNFVGEEYMDKFPG